MNKRQTQLALAMKIALRHEDLHPVQVAMVAAYPSGMSSLVPDYDCLIVGLLHDSIEDEYATHEELLEGGLDSDLYGCVDALTRRDGEAYWDYIARLKTFEGEPGRIIKRVKLADARCNLARCESNMGYDSKAKRYRRVIEELS